jgi:hypothetical protein
MGPVDRWLAERLFGGQTTLLGGDFRIWGFFYLIRLHSTVTVRVP